MGRKKSNQEDATMEERELEGTEMTEEMTGTEFAEGTEGTEGAEGTEGTEASKEVYTDAAGNEISMSQFIRVKFLLENMSRKAIAETYKFNYRTVYGATINLVNAAEPASRGRAVSNPKIYVLADGTISAEEVLDAEGVVLTVATDRNTYIKEQVAAGVDRGKLAKDLGVSYGVVYGLTKEAVSTRQKYEVEVLDAEGNKVMISRNAYIRAQVAAGVAKADIAKELGVDYSVIWQATKTDKTDTEKFEKLCDELAKYSDKMTESSKEAFQTVIELLATCIIEEKEEAPAEVTEAETPAEATTEVSAEGTEAPVEA